MFFVKNGQNPLILITKDHAQYLDFAQQLLPPPQCLQSTCLKRQIFKGCTKFLKIFSIIIENFYTLVKMKEKLYTGAFEFRLGAICNSIFYYSFTRNCKIFPAFQNFENLKGEDIWFKNQVAIIGEDRMHEEFKTSSNVQQVLSPSPNILEMMEKI